MKFRLVDLSIRTKIISIGLLIIFLFALIIFAYIFPSIEKSMMDKKKEKIQDILRSAISIVSSINVEVSAGRISLEDGQEEAINKIRLLRYGDELKDYVWINDFTPVMIMHPFAKELVGKDLSDYRDKAGHAFFMEMVEICKKDKKGYVTYFWQSKDDPNKIVPKLSYVEVYEPWKWIFGTGIYIEDVRAEMRSLYLAMSFIVVGVVIVSLLILGFFASNIAKQVNIVKKNLELAKDGHLKSNLKAKGSDEIGVMLDSYGFFVRRIIEVVNDIKLSAEQLASSSTELAASAESSSRNAQSQAASTEEITATIEEISAGVDGISHETTIQLEKIKNVRFSVSQLNEQLSGMKNQIDRTRSLTGNISLSTKTTEASLSRMTESLSKIGASSKEMENIVGIINDISDKINLLSLNAAIEAARAGEAGRGFAVVSDEISKLADQTAQSLKSIADLIRGNESEITGFTSDVQELFKVIKAIVDGIGSIDTMAVALNNTMDEGLIVNRAVNGEFDDLKETADSIQMAIAEQKLAMEEVVKTTSDISSTAQQTSSTSEEIAASAEELSGMAESLQSKIAYFKIE